MVSPEGEGDCSNEVPGRKKEVTLENLSRFFLVDAGIIELACRLVMITDGVINESHKATRNAILKTRAKIIGIFRHCFFLEFVSEGTKINSE